MTGQPCPNCRTAISDVEVEFREQNGKLYTIEYPVVGSDQRLSVATTRPETMLGDTALAVHPEDERYAKLIGGEVFLPIANRNFAGFATLVPGGTDPKTPIAIRVYDRAGNYVVRHVPVK